MRQESRHLILFEEVWLVSPGRLADFVKVVICPRWVVESGQLQWHIEGLV